MDCPLLYITWSFTGRCKLMMHRRCDCAFPQVRALPDYLARESAAIARLERDLASSLQPASISTTSEFERESWGSLAPRQHPINMQLSSNRRALDRQARNMNKRARRSVDRDYGRFT